MRPDHPEALALHSAIWGDLDATREAVQAGDLTAELFAYWRTKVTAEAVVALVGAGQPPAPEAVFDYLHQTLGLRRDDAGEAVLLVGTFAAAGCRLGGLAYYLDLLTEERARRAVGKHLAGLANAMYSPGGAKRVAAKLGVAV